MYVGLSFTISQHLLKMARVNQPHQKNKKGVGRTFFLAAQCLLCLWVGMWRHFWCTLKNQDPTLPFFVCSSPDTGSHLEQLLLQGDDFRGILRAQSKFRTKQKLQINIINNS